MNTQSIKKYRSVWMAIAFILIEMFHCFFRIANISTINFIFENGYLGVDIFIFLSGMGIYYSLEKNTTKQYFKNRFMRIVPYFFLIALYRFSFNYRTALLNVLTLQFWIFGEYFIWYIPAILGFYLVAPIIKKIIDFNSKIVIILAIMFFMISFIVILNFDPFQAQFLALGRFSIFLIGYYYGYYSENNQVINNKLIVLLSLLFLFSGVLFIYYNDFFLSSETCYAFSLFFIPYLLILISNLFDKLNLNFNILDQIGRHTLCFYLVFETIYWRFGFLNIFSNFTGDYVTKDIIFFALLGLIYLLSLIYEKIIHFFMVIANNIIRRVFYEK